MAGGCTRVRGTVSALVGLRTNLCLFGGFIFCLSVGFAFILLLRESAPLAQDQLARSLRTEHSLGARNKGRLQGHNAHPSFLLCRFLRLDPLDFLSARAGIIRLVRDGCVPRAVCVPARSSLAFSRNSLPARAAACNIMRCVYPFFGWGRDLYHGDGEMAASHFFASSFFLRFSARFASTSPIAARTRRQRNATTARTGRGAFLFSQKRQHGNNNNWLYLPLQ